MAELICISKVMKMRTSEEYFEKHACMQEIGPDPAWGSILVVYPETVVCDHIVQD